jgi:HEAT repeat protein
MRIFGRKKSQETEAQPQREEPGAVPAEPAPADRGGEGEIERLIAALKDEPWWAGRGEATEALAQMGEPAVGPLIAALRHENDRTRTQAARALGSIGDARAVEPLMTVLREDKTPIVRANAAYALGDLGDARAVEPLLGALEDESVRAPAATALGQIGDPRAVEPLRAALDDADEEVREAAREALGKIGA